MIHSYDVVIRMVALLQTWDDKHGWRVIKSRPVLLVCTSTCVHTLNLFRLLLYSTVNISVLTVYAVAKCPVRMCIPQSHTPIV